MDSIWSYISELCEAKGIVKKNENESMTTKWMR